MKTVKIKLVNADLDCEFELEVPEHFADTDIHTVARMQAHNITGMDLLAMELEIQGE